MPPVGVTSSSVGSLGSSATDVLANNTPPVVLMHGARQNVGSRTAGDDTGDMIGHAREHLVATVTLNQHDAVVQGEVTSQLPSGEEVDQNDAFGHGDTPKLM
jgi:hypothetical protein